MEFKNEPEHVLETTHLLPESQKDAPTVSIEQVMSSSDKDVLGVMHLLLSIGEQARGSRRQSMVDTVMEQLNVNRATGSRVVRVSRKFFSISRQSLSIARLALGGVNDRDDNDGCDER